MSGARNSVLQMGGDACEKTRLRHIPVMRGTAAEALIRTRAGRKGDACHTALPKDANFCHALQRMASESKNRR